MLEFLLGVSPARVTSIFTGLCRCQIWRCTYEDASYSLFKLIDLKKWYIRYSCDEEYVEIRDGGTEFSPLIGRYCDSAPSTQYSTDNIVFIKFFTDTDEPKNGFKAKISLGSCGGTVRGYTGGIVHSESLNGGQKQNCTWYIIGPLNHYLTINLTVSEINCWDHSLIVYEELLDSASNGKYIIQLVIEWN